MVDSCCRHGQLRTRCLAGVRRNARLPFRTHPEITQRLRGAKRRFGVRQRQAPWSALGGDPAHAAASLPTQPAYDAF